MRKKLCKVLLFMLGFMGLTTIHSPKVKAEDWNQNYSVQTQVRKGVFTFHVTPSEDEKKAWIHKIDIAPGIKKNAVLNIPETINGMTVTKLGAEPDEEDPDMQSTLFGVGIETYHEIDGSTPRVNKIKTMTIPNSVKSITYYAFSGMDGLEKVILPES